MERLDTDIKTIHRSGQGDMGDVSDKASPARFRLRDAVKKGYVLVSFKVHVSGGSGTATLTLRVDHAKGSNFDVVEATTLNPIGTGAGGKTDHTWVVPRDEYPHYSWSQESELVAVWTDPDGSKATRWGIEIKLAPYAYTE